MVQIDRLLTFKTRERNKTIFTRSEDLTAVAIKIDTLLSRFAM